jgi:hypothetical protein
MHVAVLLCMLIAFPSASMDSSPLVAIPIDLATPGEITQIKAGMKDAKDAAPLAAPPKEEKPEVVKEKAEAEPEPETTPAPPEKAKEPPKPQQKAEKPKEKAPPEPAKEKKAAEKKPAADAKPKPAPKPKPASKPKKQESNTDRIAALLNKIPDAVDEAEPQELAEETRPVRGQSDGMQSSMSVNEIDALRARIAQCWSPPPGGLGADKIVVRIRLQLNEDGTLVGYPTVANRGTSPFFQAAADSAVRAVFQCQPYSLPSDKYALWRDMILNFDPSDMYRSG